MNEYASKYNWSRLTHLQVGRYAEYLVKMEFTMYGFDVYTPEVDDKCIDLVIRKREDHYYGVQVRSCRNLNYIFLPKRKFSPRKGLYLAMVLFTDGQEPKIYLIPSNAWLKPNRLFVGRDYEGMKSKPEWGLNLSGRNLPLLESYSFEAVARRL